MKQLSLLFFALLLSLPGRAQQFNTLPPVYVPETTAWGHSVDSLLQYVDKSRIASGILYDRVLPLAALPYFDRFRADTSSAEHLRQAYLELYLSAYNQAGFAHTPSQLRERAQALARRDSVPLAVLDYRLHYLDTLAVYHNQLSLQNGLYYDGPGAGSPYRERLLTLAAPLVRSVPQQARFYLDPTLLLGNRGRAVSSLLVNFDNGAAPVLCQSGQAVSVSYPSVGPKVLQFTVQFADGSTAQARARLLVEAQPGVASRGAGTASRTAGTGLVIRLNPNLIEARDAFQDYNGSRSLYGRGEALAVLHHPTSKSEGTGFSLRNPVIIMDGFDPNDESKLDVDTKDSKSLSNTA